jgi:hypothetical protein
LPAHSNEEKEMVGIRGMLAWTTATIPLIVIISFLHFPSRCFHNNHYKAQAVVNAIQFTIPLDLQAKTRAA